MGYPLLVIGYWGDVKVTGYWFSGIGEKITMSHGFGYFLATHDMAVKEGC